MKCEAIQWRRQYGGVTNESEIVCRCSNLVSFRRGETYDILQRRKADAVHLVNTLDSCARRETHLNHRGAKRCVRSQHSHCGHQPETVNSLNGGFAMVSSTVAERYELDADLVTNTNWQASVMSTATATSERNGTSLRSPGQVGVKCRVA